MCKAGYYVWTEDVVGRQAAPISTHATSVSRLARSTSPPQQRPVSPGLFVVVHLVKGMCGGRGQQPATATLGLGEAGKISLPWRPDMGPSMTRARNSRRPPLRAIASHLLIPALPFATPASPVNTERRSGPQTAPHSLPPSVKRTAGSPVHSTRPAGRWEGAPGIPDRVLPLPPLPAAGSAARGTETRARGLGACRPASHMPARAPPAD